MKRREPSALEAALFRTEITVNAKTTIFLIAVLVGISIHFVVFEMETTQMSTLFWRMLLGIPLGMIVICMSVWMAGRS